MKGDTKHR